MYKLLRYFSCISTFLLVYAIEKAQAQYLHHISAYNFVGASNVYHILRDRTGFLWFCTSRGLARYDGTTMRYFTKQDGLPDNIIFNAYEDREGRMWPFSYNGKYSFIQNDFVHNEANDPMLAALPHTNSYVTYMASDSNQNLYMGFLSRSVLRVSKGIPHWDYLAAHESGGLEVLANRIRFVPWLNNGLMIDKGKGSLLVSDSKGIKVFSRQSLIWRLDDTMLNNQTVTDLTLSGNLLIVCTNLGLEIIDMTTRARKSMLQGMRVSGCTEDIAGNYWISTANNGIYKLHGALTGIRALPQIDGSDWLSVSNDKLIFTRNNTLYELLAGPAGITTQPVDNLPNYCNPLFINNELFAFYDTRRKHSVARTRNGTKLMDTGVYFKRIFSDSSDRLFVIGKDKTFLLRNTGARLTPVGTGRNHTQRISVWAQDAGSKNVYYVSGDSLLLFCFKKGAYRFLCSPPAHEDVVAILARHDKLFIGTGTNRYYIVDVNKPAPKIEVRSTDFPVLDFVPLPDSGIALRSETGTYIVRGESRTYEKIVYPFSSSAYEHVALFGPYFIASIDEKYYYFNPALLNRRQIPHSLYLKNIVVNGKVFHKPGIEIKNAGKTDLQINIGMLDFGNNGHTLLYRIVGPEGNGMWNTTDALQIAVALPVAGQYRIEMLPAYSGISEKPLVLSVAIHPPFFRSKAFLVVCGMAIVALAIVAVLLIFRYRKRHFLRELDYLKMEQRAVNALLNPHFIFNSINNIQGLILNAEKTEAADYLSTLSRLVRQNLENLKYNLIPLEHELNLVERYVKLQNLRFRGNIHLRVDCEDDRLLQVYVLPLLVHTFVENAIVHGYRHKHIPFHIRIGITGKGQDYLAVRITDNGIGVVAASQNTALHFGSSTGISFSRKRLDRLSQFYGLQQSVSVTDLATSGGQGTEVCIIIYARLRALFDQKQPGMV